jgi:O-antigen ligase
LTTARGGFLFTVLLAGVALLLSGISIGRILGAGLAVSLLLGVVWLLAALLLPEFFERITEQYAEEGLETNRFKTFAVFTRIAFDNPFGLGLHPENLKPLKMTYGIKLASAHNTFIDMAVKMGILGLLAFLALLGHILARNLRALLLSRATPERYRALSYLFLYVIGFAAAGIVEPIYDSGSKLPHMLWIISGISYAASMRALAPLPEPAARSAWKPVAAGRVEHG